MPMPLRLVVTNGSKIERQGVGGDPRPAVDHVHLDGVGAARARAQQDVARLVGVRDGLERVRHQIQHDLLQLDAVARHQR